MYPLRMASSSRRRKKKKWRPKRHDLALLGVAALVLTGAVLTMQNSSRPTAVVTAASPTAIPSPSIPANQSTARRGALFIGDSYTAGNGAGGPFTGEACLTAHAMNWRCNLDAEGGTGFFADGHTNSMQFAPVADRLAKTKELYPSSDVVLIDVGRNDGKVDRSILQPAVATYLKQVRLDYPQAALVLIVPYYMTSQEAPLGPEYTAFLGAQARLHHATVIDPFVEGWISPALTGKLTAKDGVHPSPAGHAWIATHLAASLRAARIGV